MRALWRQRRHLARAVLRRLWRALTDPPAPRYGRPRPGRAPLPEVTAILFANRQIAEDYLRGFGGQPKRAGGPLFVMPDGTEILAITPILARRRGWYGYSLTAYTWHSSCSGLSPLQREPLEHAARDIGLISARRRP